MDVRRMRVSLGADHGSYGRERANGGSHPHHPLPLLCAAAGGQLLRVLAGCRNVPVWRHPDHPVQADDEVDALRLERRKVLLEPTDQIRRLDTRRRWAGQEARANRGSNGCGGGPEGPGQIQGPYHGDQNSAGEEAIFCTAGLQGYRAIVEQLLHLGADDVTLLEEQAHV